jgi:predicted DCC family thiol-disulfide oxidoreductase YuxK
VIRRDPGARFSFAPLQSDIAKELLSGKPDLPDSIILFESGEIYVKSTAALRVARHLSGAWPLIYGAIVIPPFIRDWMYDWIAKNRYSWFGRKDACMIPTAGLASRFIG